MIQNSVEKGREKEGMSRSVRILPESFADTVKRVRAEVFRPIISQIFATVVARNRSRQ
jgi:hypothetical protein